MGVRIALLILTTFASAWVWIGLQFSSAPPATILLPLAISAALLAAGWREAPMIPTGGSHSGKLIGLWSAIEVAGIVVAANVLQHLGRNDLVFSVAAIIVGLHFFPIARGVPLRLYHATGAGFVLAGLVALLLPASVRPMVVGMSAGLVLWGTALAIVVQARRRSARQAA